VGCNELAKKIRRIKPRVHICGHIHASYGHAILGETLYINASLCTENYTPSNKPIIFDIDPSTKEWKLVHTF
jgi:Icc-related predicted phosphoesterase